MFLGMIEDSQREVIEYLDTKYQEWDHLRKTFVASHSSDTTTTDILDCLLQAALFSEDGITVEQLAEVCQCSENTVRNRLRKFHDVLMYKTIKRTRYYQLDVSKISEEI